MAVIWSEASSSVLSTAQDLIDRYHPHLKKARILFVFRSEAAKSNGRRIFGHAAKVSPQMRILLDDADFIIWISEHDWEANSAAWREALIDHVLCHCLYFQGECSIRPHDVEEFAEIVERHGLWNTELLMVNEAIQRMEKQSAFSFVEPSGGVITINGRQIERMNMAFESTPKPERPE
ncbi:MAG: putative metallopeptidase [Anaerolineales bacterium]|nr:putative metallopeptidase [Anaerolineales bacterium]